MQLAISYVYNIVKPFLGLVDEAAKQELDRLLEDSGSDFIPSSSSDSESESDSDSSGTFKLQEEETRYPTPPKKSRQQIKDYVSDYK